MYARVSTYQGQAGLTDEVVAQMTREQEQAVMPAVRSMAGFQGVVTMYDPESGKSLSVTLWQDEASMQSSEADADTLREKSAAIAQEEIRSVERFRVEMFEMV
jgi:heme-degrading monooxygenase HmoA